MKQKGPFVPADRQETIRKQIIIALKGDTLSAKDLSGIVHIREKDVYEHLSHIQKSIQKDGGRLVILPSECRKCGFSFKKRERFKKPGKCPVCRNESIVEPLFHIE
jgi:predicted Zn-ribbon and HTH transcriptional regulator